MMGSLKDDGDIVVICGEGKLKLKEIEINLRKVNTYKEFIKFLNLSKESLLKGVIEEYIEDYI